MLTELCRTLDEVCVDSSFVGHRDSREVRTRNEDIPSDREERHARRESIWTSGRGYPLIPNVHGFHCRLVVRLHPHTMTEGLHSPHQPHSSQASRKRRRISDSPSTDPETVLQRAADLIRSAKRIVVITGAGISTSSGIPGESKVCSPLLVAQSLMVY